MGAKARDEQRATRRERLRKEVWDFIKNFGMVDAQDVASAINISTPEAGRYLAEFERKGMLDKEIHYTKTKLYTIKES